MMLSSQDLKRIREREAENERRRQAWRDSLAKQAAEHFEAIRTRNGPPEAKIEIPFGDFGRAVIGTRSGVQLTLGELCMKIPHLDERAISQALLRLQTPARKWPDGTLRGVKRLIRKDGKWISPSQGTVWEGDMLSAAAVPEVGEVRGHEGIHAVWPDKLRELTNHQGALVEIAGWGTCVMGDLGWRAQNARVVRTLLTLN